MSTADKRRSHLAIVLFMVALATASPRAQAQVAEPQAIVYTQEDLDQLLAPVALYPDALLVQVLAASTYPLEVVQAARFAERNPKLKGDALARAVEPLGWDPSVTSLVQFPSVLAMMNDKLDWAQQLGDAFLYRPEVVMDTVQSLRAKAQAAGNLHSNNQQQVVIQERTIVIESTRPRVVFVPYYNPLLIYGSWWWPARQPWYWVPPPIYRPPTWGQAVATGIVWSVALGITQSIWYDARPNWRDRQVVIVNVNIVRPGVRPGVWQHNPVHRQGVAYRDLQTRERFRPVDKVAVGNRLPYRGRDENIKLPVVRPAPVTRPAPPAVTKPALPPTVGPAPKPAVRPAAPRPMVRPAPAPRPTVLLPTVTRDAARAQSERGRASREAPAPGNALAR